MNKRGMSEGLWYAIIIFLTVFALILLMLFGGVLRDKLMEYLKMLMDFLRL